MADRESALKHLHTRLHDSIDGYEAALGRTDSPYLKAVIGDMLTRRRENVAELHTKLTAMGIESSHEGSTLAAAHRTFLDLKDKITGSGDEAVLEEIVRGEQSLLSAYNDALEAAGAGDPEYGWLSAQYTWLKAKVQEFETRAKAA